MSIHYKSNEQIVIEIKKLMLEKQISQREIAEQLNIKPQGLTKLLNKKNFGFEDAQKILSAMGYDLIIDFEQIADPADSPKQYTFPTVGRFYIYYDIITFYMFCPHRRERTSYCCRFASHTVIVPDSGGLFMFPRVPHFPTSPF